MVDSSKYEYEKVKDKRYIFEYPNVDYYLWIRTQGRVMVIKGYDDFFLLRYQLQTFFAKLKN